MRRALSVLSVAVLSTAIAGSAFAATSTDLASRSGSSATGRERLQGEAAGRRSARTREGDRPEPRQRLGPGRGSHDAVVGERRGQRRLDAVRRHGRHHPTGGRRDRRADRSGVQRQHGLHGDGRVRIGAVRVPVLDRGRDDQRLEPGRARAEPVDAVVRGRGPHERGRELQGPRDRLDARRQHVVRHGLPQRQGRHVRQHVRRREHRDDVRRSRTSPPASRRSGSRRSATRSS